MYFEIEATLKRLDSISNNCAKLNGAIENCLNSEDPDPRIKDEMKRAAATLWASYNQLDTARCKLLEAMDCVILGKPLPKHLAPVATMNDVRLVAIAHAKTRNKKTSEILQTLADSFREDNE